MIDVTEIRATLFDERWYRTKAPSFTGDAYEHFVRVGWKLGLSPHPLFDTIGYLEAVPHLRGGAEDPLRHYVREGADAGVKPHPLFDTRYYLERYGDAIGGQNPLIHYMYGGAQLGFDPSPFFLSSFYSAAYLVGVAMNPLSHYAMFGADERDRNPHPDFDAAAYARFRRVPAGENPLVHFLKRLDAAAAIAAPPERPDVSIIVLNWNKAVLTLLSVVDALCADASRTVEVVVVDNGSPADDFAILAEYLPRAVTLVRLPVNRYFGEGNNLGVEASRGRNLLFLNNDTFVLPETLPALLRVFAEHDDAGAVGARLVFSDGRLQECGATVTSCGTVVQRGKFLDDRPERFGRTEPVDYVSAACLLVSRSLFDQVGGFDLTWEPAYYEDADLCLRISLIGKKTYYCRDALAMHLEHATAREDSHGLRLTTVVEVNREKFITRWGDYLEQGKDPAAASVTLPAPLLPVARGMKTAVLCTAYGLDPGGGERYLLTMAQQLAERYETYVLTPEPYSSYRLRTVARDLDLDLSRVRLGTLAELVRLKDCAVFISIGNEVFPWIPATGQRRLFVCQFPFPLKRETLARNWTMLETYEDVVVYSEFAAKHFVERRRRLGRDGPSPTVLAPPVPTYDAHPGARVPGRILNVGRFAPLGHCKRQDTLIEAFRLLIAATGRTDLELHFVGVVSTDPASREFFVDAQRRARDLPVYFHVNAPPGLVADLYATSSTYWHAAGFGQNESVFPERLEHFGIAIAEAMSAGAIPLVYDAGGPAALVDERFGYRWRTIDKLVQQTASLLALSDDAASVMREAAQAAARSYAAPVFADGLLALIAGPSPSGLEPPRAQNGEDRSTQRELPAIGAATS